MISNIPGVKDVDSAPNKIQSDQNIQNWESNELTVKTKYEK